MPSTRSNHGRNCVEVTVLGGSKSKSVPVTPARRQHESIFRTVPDSPKHNRLLSDDHGLDIEILTHKLQLYQLELEEAELRFKRRRTMEDKEAADVAAAKKFRDKVEKEELVDLPGAAALTQRPPRSSSLRKADVKLDALAAKTPTRTTMNVVRSKKPMPLQLVAASAVPPQEVQSAALPIRRHCGSDLYRDEAKRHWRRTTISTGCDGTSKLVMMMSGKLAEYDFTVELTPTLQLWSNGLGIAPDCTISPTTPMPSEDQIRRELETFALEEGPNIQLSRRSSVASRKRMPAAYVPNADDRLPVERRVVPDTSTILVELPGTTEPQAVSQPALVRKKSFFSRFERKIDVGDLLDMYMTEEQLAEEQMTKRKNSKFRRQTFFRRRQSPDMVLPESENPG